MASDSIRPSHAQAEQDLLQLILQESAQYPWDPAEAEAYFAEIEQATTDEWAPGELAAQGQAIAQQLNQLWAAIDEAAPLSAMPLFERLAGRVPQQVIAGICLRAQQLVSSNLSLADRMVQCVQELVPDWNSEDSTLR